MNNDCYYQEWAPLVRQKLNWLSHLYFVAMWYCQCGHPLTCLCYSHGKLPKLTIQRRKHDLKRKKNSVSHQQISQLFSFIVACEVFELSRAKKKNEVKTNSRPSNARFFCTQQFQSARKRWQTSRDCLFFFFEWSNLKAKLTKTNAIFDHLLWKECRIIQYATDGWREPLPDF